MWTGIDGDEIQHGHHIYMVRKVTIHKMGVYEKRIEKISEARCTETGIHGADIHKGWYRGVTVCIRGQI